MRTRTIQIAKDVRFPLDIAGQCLAIFGIRGSGKTNTAGAFVEELLEHGYPTVIIDPTDAWWGLRVGADGDPKKGYPVVIFGGSHGDIPLEESSGKVIADFVVKEHVPIVLSVRHLRKGAQRRFVRELCEELYQLKGEPQHRTPLAVVIDEAPLFAPQKVIGDMSFVVGAVEDLIARGRTSGFGVVLISQRSATLNADVRTQADTMICHRLTAKLDRKAIVEWFEENASTEDLKTILESLAKLQDGEGWVWAPKLDIMQRAQMRRRRTFDSSATPKLGEKIRPPKKLADVDLDKLKNQMAAVIERAKAEDPKALRARIAELERQAKAKAPAPAPVLKAPKVQRVEVPVLSAKDRKLLDRVASKAADHAAAATTQATATTGLTRKIVELIAKAAAAATCQVPPGSPHDPRAHGVEVTATTSWDRIRTGLTNGGARVAPKAPPNRTAGVPPARQKILNGLAFVEQVLGGRDADRIQLAFLSEQSPSSGSYANHLGALRSANLIDYPAHGRVALTDTGRAIAVVENVPTTSAELHAIVQRRLPPVRWKIMASLLDAFPSDVDRAELAKRSDQSPSSGAYANHLGALRSLGLLDYPNKGRVIVTPALFLEGR
jgi:hypothetical protein